MTISEATKFSSEKPIATRSLIWLGAVTTGVVVDQSVRTVRFWWV